MSTQNSNKTLLRDQLKELTQSRLSSLSSSEPSLQIFVNSTKQLLQHCLKCLKCSKQVQDENMRNLDEDIKDCQEFQVKQSQVLNEVLQRYGIDIGLKFGEFYQCLFEVILGIFVMKLLGWKLNFNMKNINENICIYNQEVDTNIQGNINGYYFSYSQVQDRYIKSLSKNLQKLRFLQQIQNMKSMQLESCQISNYLVRLDFDDVVECVINNCLKQRQRQNQNQILRSSIRGKCLIYLSMNDQISNLSQEIIEKLLEIIKIENYEDFCIQLSENKKQNTNTNNSNQINNNTNINHHINKKQDLVLKYIQKRQKQLSLNNNRQISKKHSFQTSQSQKQNNILFQQNLKKHKMIYKERTIYHQRKNLYIPRSKRTHNTHHHHHHNTSQKSDSLDYSTQWSSSFQKQRLKRTIRDFNQDFQDDILVGKTPVPYKKLVFTKPISFKIQFND